MSDSDFSKWIGDVSGGDRVNVVAEEILRARLCAVMYYLDRAGAAKRSSNEDVHLCRVWTRRAIAAIALCSPLLPRKDGAWLTTKLKRIRNAAGAARDDDVLMERLRKAGMDRKVTVFRELEADRRRAQRPIRRIHAELIASGKLRRRVKKILRRVRKFNRGNRGSFATWADRQVHRTLTKFFAAAERAGKDPSHLHKFRIRGKALRYTMELTASVYPPSYRDEIYPVVEELQRLLGDLNDHAVAKQRFQRWCASSGDVAERKELGAMSDRETDEFAASLQAFRVWWTKKRQTALREAFRQCLGIDNL